MKIIMPLLLFFPFILVAQETVNALYAGSAYNVSPMMGGGMTRTDIAIYFRKDGTYTSKLKEQDWQTRVDGTYQITGGKIVMAPANGKQARYLSLGDNIETGMMGGATMIRMEPPDHIPGGYYKFTFTAGAGGFGFGSTYVGKTSINGLYFDGRSRFGRDGFSAVSVSGDNIGGGSVSELKSNGEGSYSIKDGLLTLNYDDGRKVTMSFFVSEGEKSTMAVINGNIYFMKGKNSGDKENKKVTGGSKTAVAKGAADRPPSFFDSPLANIYEAHGGEKLDRLKTIRCSINANGVKVKILADLRAKRMRVETLQNKTPVLIEQMEGNSGWIWKNGRMSELSSERVKEMQSVFYTGIPGLRLVILQDASILKSENKGRYKTFLLDVNGEKVGYVAETGSHKVVSSVVNGKTTYYKNFREIDGVLIPLLKYFTGCTTGLQNGQETGRRGG